MRLVPAPLSGASSSSPSASCGEGGGGECAHGVCAGAVGGLPCFRARPRHGLPPARVCPWLSWQAGRQARQAPWAAAGCRPEQGTHPEAVGHPLHQRRLLGALFPKVGQRAVLLGRGMRDEGWGWKKVEGSEGEPRWVRNAPGGAEPGASGRGGRGRPTTRGASLGGEYGAALPPARPRVMPACSSGGSLPPKAAFSVLPAPLFPPTWSSTAGGSSLLAMASSTWQGGRGAGGQEWQGTLVG